MNPEWSRQHKEVAGMGNNMDEMEAMDNIII